MKIINRYIFSLLSILLVVAGCTTDRGGIDPRVEVDITRVPAIITKVDPSGSQSIDVINLGSFQGKVVVSEYFDEGPKPTKVDLVVRKNGKGGSNVKLVQADITTFPTSVTVSAGQLTQLFGIAPVLGDNYDFSVDIYVGTQKFEAFPAVGKGTATGPAGMPGYSEFARFGAICAYNSNIYQGQFEVVSDDWEELEPGTIITLTKVSETSFSFEYPEVASPKPIVVKVNPNTNALSFDRQSVGGNWNWGAPYTGSFLSGGGSGSLVFPCEESLTIELAYGVDQGSWGGTYPLVLKKVK